MHNHKKINFLYSCFFLLVILSLIQGYYCKFLPELSSWNKSAVSSIGTVGSYSYHVCTELFENYWEENGFIENLQVIFVLISIILLIKIKFKFKKINFIHLFIIIKILALIYYLGEEISWGQHFFKWKSPIIFQQINNQKETNLHNISNLFDQLPRALVFFWCAFSLILINFVKYINKISKEFFLLISPDKKLIYISLLLLALSLPNIIVDKLNLHPGHYEKLSTGETIPIPASAFIDMITFNYIRLSELHELIFSFYFLSYSIFINQIKEKILIN